jgi:phosphodiesterase/alkaline phosphatase D-like protein
MSRRTRREFVRDGAALAAGVAVGGQATSAEPSPQAAFQSDWRTAHDRVWVGREYWANPLQDWRIQDGRLECVNAAPERHVHQLTHALGTAAGHFRMQVDLRRADGTLAGPGSAGFRIGIRGPLDDYRNALIFGQGLDLGITGAGKLFIGSPMADDAVDVDLSAHEVELVLQGNPQGEAYALELTLLETPIPRPLGRVRREKVPGEKLIGGLALVANFGTPGPRLPKASGGGVGRFTFDRWEAVGEKVERHPERAFGPILFSQYTLSRGVLKMSVQMPPLGKKDSPEVRMDVMRDGRWRRVERATIDEQAHVAVFRVEKWDDSRDWPYRLSYTLLATNGQNIGYEWTGTVRRDPVDQDVLTVADISCNGHMAFPNAEYVANVARLNPDLLAFVGDQFYESSGGYGVQRGPLEAATLDLLRKWYLHGWTWRDLTRDRPSVSIPDDHDVYQGNIWGEGGKPRRGTQEMGGYDMPPQWVNVVHRTQTAHHPDPFDAAPAERGISVYYGPLVYGRVSFAILADRQFKSGPEGKVPPTGSKRGDHVVDPSYDPKTADLPGLEFLGARQMEFLREWVSDWRGADMKAVISQTVFTAMATTHGADRQVLVADYDAGGWPQTARNDALRELRKALAFHIAGDQHLPAVVQYGIDAHRDAIAAVAGPAVNSIYPRWFEPRQPGQNRAAGAAENTGDFVDHFGHPLTVLAVANPRLEFRADVLEAQQDKACGIAVVRFEKPKRRITIECWPILADPLAQGTQFPGWPVTIDPAADGARRAAAWLPILKIVGSTSPLVQVFDGAGELVYNLRVTGETFRPHVFAAGMYTVRVVDPERGHEQRLDGLVAREQNDETIEVSL